LPSKRKRSSDAAAKEVRKLLTLSQKIDVLDKQVCGVSVAAVGQHFHINESSIRTITRSQANALQYSIGGGVFESLPVVQPVR
jgi:hypothetical protein